MIKSTSKGKRKFGSVPEENKVVEPTRILRLNNFQENAKQEEEPIVAEVCERSQLQAPYDSNIRDVLAQSTRYKNLRPAIVLNILDARCNYKYLKKIAISHLAFNLKKQFAIISQIVGCKQNEVMTSDELSHDIFSWNWNNFLARRSLKDFVWIDILLRMEESQLHLYKFQKDLEELQLLTEKIFDDLFSNMEDEDINIYHHVENPTEGAKKALQNIHSIEKEFYMNSKELKYLHYKEHFFMNASRESETHMLKTFLESRIWNSHIWDPIEVRYRVNWLRNLVEQHQHHTKKSVENYEADIALERKKLEIEMFINGSCMDHCYSSIEMYKTRLVEIQDKFDKELENRENKLSSIRLQTVKLREQRNWLTIEMERLREEEEKLRICIKIEKENEQQQNEKSLQPKSNRMKQKKVRKRKGQA